MGMNWSRPAVVLVALLVSGCGSGSAAHTEHVHGTLVRVGGPLPGGPVVLAGARLEIRGAGGSVRVRTDDHGRFAFDLPAGVYHVRALGRSILNNGSCSRFRVRSASGRAPGRCACTSTSSSPLRRALRGTPRPARTYPR